ncbi:Tetracycline resistance protein, class C [Candidatus Hepatincola sp. Pdp]
MILLTFITFIDLLGFGIIFPLLPAIQGYLHLNDLQIGYMASIFSLAALFGCVLWGVLSDKYGRKYLVVFPLLATALTYLLTVYSKDFYSLLLLRFLCGFFASHVTVIFAITMDISKPEEKMKNFGVLSAGLGLGFILGPTLGGTLVKLSTYYHMLPLALPFYTSAALSLIGGLLAFKFLKESLSAKERAEKSKGSVLQDVRALYTQKTTIILTYLSVITFLLFSGLEVYLTLWLSNNFHFSAPKIGIYWGVFSIIITITQLTLPRFLSNHQALVGGFILFAISQLLLLVTYNIYILFLMTTIFAISFGIVMPAINVHILNLGAKNQQGLLFGINQSLGNLGRLIGPYLLGIIYQINHSWAWLFSAMIAIVSTFITIIFYRKES